MIEAGIDIDMAVMNLVGTRGLIIAVVGSFLPIGVGILIAWAIDVGDWKAIIASGAVFGPTSLGIALNVLKGGKISFDVSYACITTTHNIDFKKNIDLISYFQFYSFLLHLIFGIQPLLVSSRWNSQYVSFRARCMVVSI